MIRVADLQNTDQFKNPTIQDYKDSTGVDLSTNKNYETNIYDGDTTKAAGFSYRTGGIDAPEMEKYANVKTLPSSKVEELAKKRLAKLDGLLASGSLQQDEYEKTKSAIQGQLTGLGKREAVIANAGDTAKMANEIAQIDPRNALGVGETRIIGDDATTDKYGSFVSVTDDRNAPWKRVYGSSELDKYGRVLIDNDNLENELLASGNVVPYNVSNPEQVEIARKAKEAGKGLWGSNREAIQKVADKRGLLADDTDTPDYNMLRGVGAGALTVGAKVGSLVGEGIESFGEKQKEFLVAEQKRLDKEFAGEKVSDLEKSFADAMIGTGKAIQDTYTKFQTTNMADKVVGYDRTDLDNLSKQIDKDVKEKGFISAYLKPIVELDPRALEATLGSLPEMAALAVSTGTMAIANANNNINIAESKLKRELTPEEKVVSAGVSIAGTYIDRLGDKLALSGMNPTKEFLKKSIDNAPDSVKDAIASTYGKAFLTIGEAPLRVVGATAVEGATEKVQTLGEIAAQNPEVFDRGFSQKELDESNVAAVLGALGGTHLSTPVVGYSVIKDRSVNDAIKEVSGKIREEASSKNPTDIDSELKMFEDSVRDGAIGLDIKRLNSLVSGGAESLTEDQSKKVAEIVRTFKANKAALLSKATGNDGVVDGAVLRSNPLLVDDLLSKINSRTIGDEEAALIANSFINTKTLADHTDEEVAELMDRVMTLRQSKVTDEELSAIQAVSNDIFAKGFLDHKSIVDALANNDLSGAGKFIGYEVEKLGKLEQAVSNVKDKVNKIAGGDPDKLEALAYLEGVHLTGKKGETTSGVSREYEAQMIRKAAELLGMTTLDGNKLRAAYKESPLSKEVKKASETISGFTNERYSGNAGKFEVNGWEVLAELVDPGTQGKLKVPGFRKLITALNTEVSVLGKVIEGEISRKTLATELVSRMSRPNTPVKKPEPVRVEEPILDTLVRMADRIEEGVEVTELMTPNEAKAAEDKIKLEIVVKSKLYKETVKWINDAKEDLNVLYSEVNELQAVTEIKSQEIKKKYRKEIDLISSELRSTKRTINRLENEVDGLKEEINLLVQEKTTLKMAAKIIGQMTTEIKKAVSKIVKKLGVLKSKLEAKEVELAEVKTSNEERMTELENRLKVLTDKRRYEFEEAESSIREKRESISKTKEGIVKTEEEAKKAREELTELVKKREEIRKLYKPSENGISGERLKHGGKLVGWSKPLVLKRVDGETITVPPLNSVLELGNGVAPLANVKYTELVSNREVYDNIVKDVNKVITADNLVKNSTANTLKYVSNEGGNIDKKLLAYKAPALSLLLKSGSGQLAVEENYAIALEVSMLEWLMNDAIDVSELTAKDVSKYYGIEESEVTDEQLSQLQALGIPVKFLVEGIGSKVLAQIGYKVVGTNTEEKLELTTRLKESLGMYAILLAQYKGYVNFESKKYQEVGTALGKTAEDLKAELESDSSLAEVVTPMVSYNSTAFNVSKLFEDRVNELGIESKYNGVRFNRPSVKGLAPSIKRNKVTVAPDRLLEAKKDMMLKEWHLKGIDNDSTISKLYEADPEIVKKAMGFLTEDEIKALPVTLQKSAISKNRQIKSSVDSLFKVANTIKEGLEMNSMWFNVFIGKNLRMYIDSDGLNNQSNKMHRNLMYTDGQEVEVIKGSRSETVFKVGVAQAFGYDIDKNETSESVKFADMIISNVKDVNEGLNKILTEGVTTIKVGNEKVKVKELGHLLDGMQAVNDYVNSGSKFVTRLQVESDAVTSGFFLKMFQIASGLDSKLGDSSLTIRDWLKKVGFFVGDDQSSYLGNKGITDSYRTLGKEMTVDGIKESVTSFQGDKKKLKALVEQLGVSSEELSDKAEKVTVMMTNVLGDLVNADGSVSDLARKLFKPPFMTFMYGAGFPKMKEELAAMVVDEIFSKVVKYGELSSEERQSLDLLMMEVTKEDTAEAAYEIFMNKDIKSFKNRDGIVVYDVVEGYVMGTFGARVEDVMSREFGYMLEVNNTVLATMNAVFSVWEKKFRSKLEGSELTIDRIDEVVNELVNDFPIVEGALSTGVKDGIALFKTEMARGLKSMAYGTEIKSKYDNVGAWVDDNGKFTSRGVDHAIRVYKEAAAAAGVIPIHALDSSVMVSTVMGADAMQVWDAIVAGVGNIENLAKDYNRNVYEISMKWNFLEEVLRTAERVLGSKENQEFVKSFIEESDKFSLEDTIIALKGYSDSNKKFKEEIKQKGGTIEHMVFSEETRYKISNNTSSPETILNLVSKPVMDRINKELKSKLGATLKEMFEDCAKG